MSARTPPGDCAVSPPASLTLCLPARASKPSKKRSVQLCGVSRGSARDKNAALGTPPIAAMSLRPRARQRCPMHSGDCHSRRKWTFSRLKSVVTRASCRYGILTIAQSSPMPNATPDPLAFDVRRRRCSMNSRSDRGIRRHAGRRLTLSLSERFAPLLGANLLRLQDNENKDNYFRHALSCLTPEKLVCYFALAF